MKQLSRRTLLHGLGAAIALPALDALAPANKPARLCFVYVPNGIDMRHWTPAVAGPEFGFTPILKGLEAHRQDLLVLSGLTHNNGRALGDGAGDHARAAASFLTGVHPRKTAGADIKNGISADQVAALKLGSATRFASLELGCEDGRMVGSCDSGYSCAYSNTISWRNETSPLPVEVSPRVVFERLFGADALNGGTAEDRARRERYRKSILDYAAEDARALKRELGPTDNRKLDEYLHAIRDIERRIELAEKQDRPPVPQLDVPAGMPAEFADHVKLMFDLLHVAFQTDQTRVATFMIAREGSSRAYRELGISDGHHPLTHHRNDIEMMDKITKINAFHIELFAHFLKRLKETPDGDGSLLDHSLIVYGSGISDGNRHSHHDLPVLVAGRGNGAAKPGSHIIYPKETPMTNLFVTLLDRAGVPAETLGDSTGKLADLPLAS